jgi:hypothetical protein
MLARCLNQNEPGYDNYGGRGIKVCNRWLEFANFFADMGERPSRMSLDRINVNGNYEPGNCRWATDREQSNNTRSNVYLDHDGRRMTVSQWAAEVGLNANAIYARLKRGWSAEESLTTAPRKTSRTAG